MLAYQVIVPIYKSNEQLKVISEVALEVKKKLEELGVSVKFDDRDTHKRMEICKYELKGVLEVVS